MFSNIAKLVAIMATYFLLQSGHAGLGALVAQQAPILEFSDTFIGVLVAASYVGFLAGNTVVRYLLPRVSYIRAFSVCAAAIAAWTLLLPLLPSREAWLVLRFLHGVFFSSCIVIGEGWINSSVSNENRSRVFAAYMVVGYAGFGLSQYILLLGANIGDAAFSVIAIFITLSLIPLCLTRLPEPQVSSTEEGATRLSFVAAYRVSPVSFVAHFCVGLAQGGLWLFVRYAEGVSDNIEQVSFLSALALISGLALQIPVGWLADKAKDRRTVMSVVYFAAAGVCALLFFGEHYNSFILAFLIFMYGALIGTTFPLNISYGQSFIDRARSTEYTGRVYQVYASGALVGPVIVGYLMDALSIAWLFGFSALAMAAAAGVCSTSRLMPRYIPAQREREASQILSPHVPPIAADAPEYTELEVGPQMPDEEAAAAAVAAPPEVVGPLPQADSIDADEIADSLPFEGGEGAAGAAEEDEGK